MASPTSAPTPAIESITPATTDAGDNTGPTTAGAGADDAIEVDPGLNSPGGDEGYQTDGQSSATTSISSSIRDYIFENNRRYHKFQEGRYLIPNDDEDKIP